MAIAWLYRATRMEHEGTSEIIGSIRSGEGVPLVLVPVIFVSTAVTHLCGGSAGREGAALQIGGGLGFAAGRLFHLDEKEQRMATLCGMSALFSALFGTPLTACRVRAGGGERGPALLFRAGALPGRRPRGLRRHGPFRHRPHAL